MTERLSKRFNLHASQEEETIRDKDNADPRLEPQIERKPAPNLAPGGMLGIRRNLPSNNQSKGAEPREVLKHVFNQRAGKTPDQSRER